MQAVDSFLAFCDQGQADERLQLGSSRVQMVRGNDQLEREDRRRTLEQVFGRSSGHGEVSSSGE